MIQEIVNEACHKSGRDIQDVKIIAVTKYVDLERTKEVLDIGIENIGENRVQQALEKYDILHNKGTWHFIGNLQTKKVKHLIGSYNFIHSLDRISLATEIDKRAQLDKIIVNCFIQVNVSGEETKAGIMPNELFTFTEQLKQFPAIRIVGLMTMAPFYGDKELTRPIFRRLRQLRDQLNQKQILDYPVLELSMGMSNDFDIAIEEGATYVRLGSILVGREQNLLKQ